MGSAKKDSLLHAVEESPRATPRLHDILIGLAADFINVPLAEVSRLIDDALQRMGSFVDADRVYIFEYDWDAGVTNNTHEWCASGISPEITNLQGVPVEALPQWVEPHRRGEVMEIQDTLALPEGDSVREILEPQGIKSLLALPMMKREECVGFVGFDSVKRLRRYSRDEEDLLLVFAQMLVNVWERKRADREREQLQEQLIQAQKLEAVGQLAGGVAHDFNNMLGVILGRAEMAMQDIAADAPVYAELEEIKAAAQRSAEMTRQLLAFARKEPVLPKVLDVNAIISNMTTMLRRLIGEGVGLSWAPGSELWPVLMDPVQLDQVLANLCINARDAMGGVGEIMIETSNVVVKAGDVSGDAGLRPGEYVMLAVTDGGCGMSPALLEKVFEPFFTTKGREKGTGLGLSTVYGVVRQNGGYIQVHSEVGEGSTFKVFFPRGSEGASRPQVVAAPARTSGSGLVLLVEDEPAVLRMTKTMLQREGYTVLGASTPSEALQVAEARRGSLDLLITDVVMPEMTGLALARAVLARAPHVRVVYMSGYTAEVVPEAKLLEAADNFIKKPFQAVTLCAKVKEVLGEGTGRRAGRA